MFTDRIRYIISIMIHLALKGTEDYLTSSEIAEDVNIPEAYLNKIIGELGKLGYLDTKKGPKGGVRLRDDPGEIFITQLLNDVKALEHNPMGDSCCIPSYLNECIIETWTDGFKTDVVGKSTLEDVAETVS